MTPLINPLVGMPLLGLALGGLLRWLIVRGPSWVPTDDSLQTPVRVGWLPVLAASALLWFLCALRWEDWSIALPWAVFASLLLVLAWIDWQTTLLPDVLNFALMGCGLIASSQMWIDISLDQSVIGALVGFGVLWATAFAFHRITGKVGMGCGDFKLLAALGAWLGPWALMPLLFLASSAGAIAGLVLLRRHALRDGYLPFGPFLALAGGVMAHSGQTVLYWLSGA